MTEDKKDDGRPGLLTVSGLIAAFVPAFALTFTSVSDFYQSDREVNIQRLKEDRERVGEFITSVTQRRAAVANLNASLKRGYDAFEITERKRAYETAYIDSADTLYRMQNLIRTAVAPPREQRAALTARWSTSPSAFVDRRYNNLLSYLVVLDGIAQDRYECWVLEARRNAPPETAAAGLVSLTAQELASLRLREKCPASPLVVTDAATPPTDADRRFRAASGGAQLCMNQIAVEVYQRRSARRGQALQVVWNTVSRKQEDWGQIFERLDAFCPAPPPPAAPADPAALDKWTADWNAFADRVNGLQAQLPEAVGRRPGT